MIDAELIENVFQTYVEAKETVVESVGGPAGIGFRFVLIWDDYRRWPLFNEERLAEIGMVIDRRLSDDDPLMAIFDMDNDRVEINTAFAKLMTTFGAPQIAVCMSDAYRKKVPMDGANLHGVILRRGDLEREYNEVPDTDVEEMLTCSGFDCEGGMLVLEQTYRYGDRGGLIWGERENLTADLVPRGGWMTDTLQRSVALHGKSFPEMMIEMTRARQSDLN